MITIEKYSPERHEHTCELSVLEEQSQFTVADVGEMLTRLEPTELPHLILADDDVVGFFLFDAAYSEKYDFARKQLRRTCFAGGSRSSRQRHRQASHSTVCRFRQTPLSRV